MGIIINPYQVQAAVSAFDNTKSVNFDGVNDYVNLGGNPIDLTNDFSVNVWINKVDNSGGDDDRIYAQIEDADNHFQLITDNATQKFAVLFEVNNVVKINQITYGAITFDAWTCLSFTWDGTNGKFYKNGAEITTDGSTSIGAGSTFQTNIGRRPDGHSSTYYQGLIDEVSIYGSALTSGNITTIYNGGVPADLTDLSPTAWWRMGDGDTFPMLDNEQAYSNRSVDFDGVNDYVDLGDNNDFSFGDGSTDSAFSISAWIYRDGTTNDGIVAKDASSNREWAFYIYSGTLRMVLFDNSSGGYIGRRYGTTITNGEWHHVAATYDGGGAASDIKLYLNGTQVDNQGNSSGSYTAMENKGAEVRIGSKESDPLYFDGNIDEVAIFGSELSSGNVTTIYNSGTPNDISALSPLGWWKMGDGDTFATLTDNGSGSNDGTMTNMASDDITGAQTTGIMTNMVSGDIEEDVPS